MNNELLKSLTEQLKSLINEKGGSIEFAESTIIEGKYGDRAGAKHLFVKDGELCAHVYNCWMENTCASLEYSTMLDEYTLRKLICRVKQVL